MFFKVISKVVDWFWGLFPSKKKPVPPNISKPTVNRKTSLPIPVTQEQIDKHLLQESIFTMEKEIFVSSQATVTSRLSSSQLPAHKEIYNNKPVSSDDNKQADKSNNPKSLNTLRNEYWSAIIEHEAKRLKKYHQEIRERKKQSEYVPFKNPTIGFDIPKSPDLSPSVESNFRPVASQTPTAAR